MERPKAKRNPTALANLPKERLGEERRGNRRECNSPALVGKNPEQEVTFRDVALILTDRNRS